MASKPNHFCGGSKITADGDCSHEIKRRLLLGRKVMTNLDSIFKNRDITLPTNVYSCSSMSPVLQWWFSQPVVSDSCDPMDYSLPGSSVHGISQARIVETLPFPSPGHLSNPGIDRVSRIAGEFFTNWAAREAQPQLYQEKNWLGTWGWAAVQQLLSHRPQGLWHPTQKKPGTGLTGPQESGPTPGTVPASGKTQQQRRGSSVAGHRVGEHCGSPQ